MHGVTLNDFNTVLCLGAHADDIEIGCGGSLLQMIDANPQLHVHWCVFSGDSVRNREAKASAEHFVSGAEKRSVHIHDFRDSYFPDQWADIKECFEDLAKQIKPDLIFTHRPDDRHQDHRVISELTWCTFRDHLILEYEIPKYEGDLGNPNLYLPISKRYCGKKITTLLECFESQLDKPWFDSELFRSLMRIRGSECNSPSRYAEAFHCRKATCDFLPSKG
jgi:LmbE family N-acetylglucosaminyl deacetylase